MSKKLFFAAVVLLACGPLAVRAQNDRKISEGMGRLLQGDRRRVDETLERRISNGALRLEIAAVLNYFRARDSQMAAETPRQEKVALSRADSWTGDPQSLAAIGNSSAALSSRMKTSALERFRLYVHSALASAAKKYGLDACPFGK
ncbi:MAG: hypothetical protein HY077_18655 [Elusimicrobia bacterium]|nr:hypothetical protein [Elusimicrobiota bacterium]